MRPLGPGDPAEIGGYRLRSRIGGGGMGQVYLASTPGGRLVALKIVRSELSDDLEFRERFRQEIQAAKRVRGLYTAELLDADPDGMPPWLVTAYVPGPSLEDAVAAQGPVPTRLVPLLMAGVAEALQAIHAAGVVHRDLKPSNVLLSPDGPRVIDFGIARALDGVRLTGTGTALGSPQFMAPEQISALPVSPALDVFALGALGAFAALGRSPFGGENPMVLMYRILHATPDLTGCPPELRPLIERCLSKAPEDRPTPAEIIRFCGAQLGDGPAGFPQSWRAAGGTGMSPPRHAGTRTVIKSGHAATAQSQPPPAQAAAPRSGVRRSGIQRSGIRRPTAAVGLMYGAGALAVASLIVGVTTLPALRAMIGQQHPGASRDAVSTAVSIAVITIGIRGLAVGGMWGWAARDSARRRRSAAGVCTAAFAVATLGVANSYLQVLSTVPVRILGLAGWLLGLCAVAIAWLQRPDRRQKKH